MAKIPGLGGASIIGAGIALIGSELGRQSRLAQINDTDPRQKIIQEVFNELYTQVEMIGAFNVAPLEERKKKAEFEMTYPALAPKLRKAGITMRGGYYGYLVKKWCDKFGIRYNPYGCVLHSAKHQYSKYSDADRTDEKIEELIRIGIDAYEKEAAQHQQASGNEGLSDTAVGVIVVAVIVFLILLFS